MTEKTKKPAGVIETFDSMTDDNRFDAVLTTVLTDYEPQNTALAISLERRESIAIERLKSKRYKYDTDPKNLVRWYIKNLRNPDEYDIGSFYISQWIYCRRIRHYLKKGNPESAVLSALDSERETLRLSKYVMNLGWEIDEGKKKRRTMPAQTANRRKKREKIGLLVDIMKSRGHTPISIDRKRNEKMLVFSLLNNELKKQRKKEISKPTYHLYLKELRENSFNDAPENN